MYDYLYPIERRVMEDRLSFLEKEYFRFEYMINPYHLNPGILLDVDITSIKRKKATLDSMANVLNEFLHGVSKGFQDAAFASFSRRRSTVREDITQSFSTAVDDKTASVAGTSAGVAYLDLINADESPAVAADTRKSIAAPKRSVGPAPSRSASLPRESAASSRGASKGAVTKDKGRVRGREAGLKEV